MAESSQTRQRDLPVHRRVAPCMSTCLTELSTDLWFLSSEYRGEFVHNQYHGEGRYTCQTDNEVYKGRWVKNQLNGQGGSSVPSQGPLRVLQARTARLGKCFMKAVGKQANGMELVGAVWVVRR